MEALADKAYGQYQAKFNCPPDNAQQFVKFCQKAGFPRLMYGFLNGYLKAKKGGRPRAASEKPKQRTSRKPHSRAGRAESVNVARGGAPKKESV